MWRFEQEHLIALRDISDTVKAGDRFDAPDRLFVALGWARDAPKESAPSEPTPPPVESEQPEDIEVPAEPPTEQAIRSRRGRTRRVSASPTCESQD